MAGRSSVRRRAHRTLRRALLLALLPLFRLRRTPPRGRRLRIRVLLQHAYGTGGTIRTVLNLCGHLAEEHDVEIVSVVRSHRDPFFRIPPGVTVTFADDRTEGSPVIARLPSLLTPGGEASLRGMNLWTDLRLLRTLWRGAPDVLIGTRPSLNLLIAALAPRGTITIGQDHMNLPSYRPHLRREIVRSYGRLTALAVLTEKAQNDYEAALAGTSVRITRIPNALPELSPGGPSPRDAKVILAAGRLVRQKGFDLLLRAYEPLAAEHPDWTLRIFGAGHQRDRLRKEIADLGLTGTVELRARTPDLAREMRRSSIYVLSSRFEGMPMVIIEAMSLGLPVVAFDCPTGPAEMITPDHDGLLVPPDDVTALSTALRTLMEDATLRNRLGDEALRSAAAYDPARVAAQWRRLLTDLRENPLHPRPRIRHRRDQPPDRKGAATMTERRSEERQ
ncbi:glycosyltransferase family 4 protein [Actinomadura fulvescens]|uniref:Glycosyl transferase family 1 domain-containing protein n=1 Tax=Actinomadura fulvescens TaxID=46160 RepID=A0ABN3QH03_9ACTN